MVKPEPAAPDEPAAAADPEPVTALGGLRLAQTG